MSELLTPVQIEQKARERGLSMAEVCRRAPVAPSTWTRWKAGEREPQLAVYRRICAVVEAAQ